MALKTFKSYTKSTRGTVLVDKKNLWKGKPLKSLTVGSHSTGGRNNLGRITSRHKGANKKSIKKSIEKIFKVNVVKVNTTNFKGKTKIVRGRKSKKTGYKKAIVTLKKGQTIDLSTGI